jgi:hypothetical protein
MTRRHVTLIERRSSSWMRYSAVPASALLLGACLAPEDPSSKSLGASEIEKVMKKLESATCQQQQKAVLLAYSGSIPLSSTSLLGSSIPLALQRSVIQ